MESLSACRLFRRLYTKVESNKRKRRIRAPDTAPAIMGEWLLLEAERDCVSDAPVPDTAAVRGRSASELGEGTTSRLVDGAPSMVEVLELPVRTVEDVEVTGTFEIFAAGVVELTTAKSTSSHCPSAPKFVKRTVCGPSSRLVATYTTLQHR